MSTIFPHFNTPQKFSFFPQLFPSVIVRTSAYLRAWHFVLERYPSIPINQNARITMVSDSSPATECKGYGKLILFGEHFVVYKAPALVGAVSAATTCTATIHDADADSAAISGTTGLTVIDDRPAIPGYKVEKKEEADVALNLVLKHFGLDPSKQPITLHFGGDLCAVSGIGASAAQVVAQARALSKALGREMTEDEINEAGYEGEKGYHGTPSGIDNTAATFGGLLRFQRTDGAPIFDRKQIAEPIRIVYASTGITASTAKVVDDVRAKKEADPAWFDNLMAQYLDLVARGERALEEGDLIALGQCMDENHTLCQKLTVSCKESDDLVEAARKTGAIGAKMSGTGRGGLMLALTPTKGIQDAVYEELKKTAPQVWKTTFA